MDAGIKGRDRAADVFRATLGAGLLLSLAANLPGHLSLDSVIALTEARSGQRLTWAPAFNSWILKPFDALVSGTGLYVTASASLLFLSLMSLPALRPRASWLAPFLAAVAIFLPQLLLYQGIVWRDVLFANLAVAGFVFLAHAAGRWEARPWVPLAGSLLCLSLATVSRQNGAVMLAVGAGAVVWLSWRRGRLAALGKGAAFLAAGMVIALLVNRLAQPPKPSDLRAGVPRLILEHYDIIGAKAHHPKLRFEVIGRVDPAAQTRLEEGAGRAYSLARVDTLDADEAFRKTLWTLPDEVVHAQWVDIVLNHPAAYVLHRANVFRWVLTTPQIDLCLPVYVGVSGIAYQEADLDMALGIDTQDAAVAAFARRFTHTPVFSHLTYAILALALIALFVRRGEPQDRVMAALLAGSLLFVASFAVLSVACDYRYLYLMDLAAIAGVLYAALDPPLRRKR